MKREKARLEALRAMSYEAYLQTPEWKDVEKAALKRVENRCQVCRAGGVALRVHHASLDNVGCEQEADVLVLCEGCYDTLAQKLQQAMQKTAEQAESGEEGPFLPPVSLGQRALVFAPAALGLDALLFLMHAPPPAEIGGLVAAFVLAAKFPQLYASIRTSLPEPLRDLFDAQAERKRVRAERAARGEWSTWDRLLGRHLSGDVPAPYTQIDEELPLGDEAEPEEDTGLFCVDQQAAPLGLERLTIEEICAHIQRNSYQVYVGRSLSKEGNPAVPLNFYKQHIEIIGVSQRGKSSMAAALMDMITRTHDPEHVQLALLDMENLTSNLFAHLPHVMTWNGTKLHARTPEEVVAHLELIVEVMNYRYSLPAQERAALPVLLIYLEEFLALKNELKNRINLLKGEQYKEEREEAVRAYAQLSLTVNMLALRGLKARIQFLLCAQVDYADKEFREALAQFGIRFSFCVDPDAARAAGFTANELLAQNFAEDRAGQAVVEAQSRKDHLLAPDYDLEKRIIAMEAKRASQWPALSPSLPETPVPGEQEELRTRKVYHTHEGAGQFDRKQARLARLRGDAPQIVPARRAQVATPAPAEPAQTALPITDLTAYLKPEQRIPSLEEVVAAFPNQLPSKRDIAKHFDITDHQAYKLYKQLEKKLAEVGGRMGGRSDEERLVKN